MKKRRRHRQPSLDAEIRLAAKQIMATQMAEAYKAAALGIVARKLDEIRAILNAAGVGQVYSGSIPAFNATGPAPVRPVATVVEHPCVQCGREGIRRTKPNAFNRTGSWYCQAHVALAAQSDFEDRVDAALIGSVAAPIKTKPVVVQTQAPAVIKPQEEAPAEPEDPLKAAMSQLGVASAE